MEKFKHEVRHYYKKLVPLAKHAIKVIFTVIIVMETLKWLYL